MAIRVQRLGAAAPVRSATDYTIELETLRRDAARAIEAADAAALRAALKVSDGWDDVHRRLQADLRLFEQVAEVKGRDVRSWAGLYHAIAAHLLERLREEPLEPARWNLLGVALFELGQTRAAERCFRAVRRLEPDHPHLQLNMRAVKERNRRTIALPLGPKFQATVKALADGARAVADRTQPVDPSTQKLSLVMIVKDEEEMLPECLASVASVVDEMIIVDTGSSDGTVAIAQSYGAKVVHFPWTGSFSDARNVSLEHATGDWVLWLDADERILAEDVELIRPLLARVHREAISMVETNYTGGEAGESAVNHTTRRLWRHRPEYRFEGAIHEQITHLMPTYLPERFGASAIRMIHYGYLKEVIDARAKTQRNLALLFEEAKNDPSPFNRFNLGNEYVVQRDWATARRYFDEAWDLLSRTEGGPASTGYGALLAVRRAATRRASGDLAGSQRAVDEGLALYPDHSDLFHAAALCARDRCEADRARQLAEQLLAMGDAPGSYGGVVGVGTFLALGLLGELAEARGDHQSAAALYRRSLDEYPHYAGVVGPLARAELACGRPVEAVVAELEPHVERRLGSAGLLLAQSLYEHAHVEEAERLYERISAAVPSDPICRVGLVECALSRGDIAAAAERAEPIEESDATAPVLLRSALFCALAREAFDHAAALLERAQELRLAEPEREAFAAWRALATGAAPQALSPAAARAAVELLNAALQLELYDDAGRLTLLARCSRLAGAERADLLGRLFLRHGFLDSAAEEWVQSVQDAGPSASALLGLAQVSFAAGRYDEAQDFVEGVLGLEPQHAGARSLGDAVRERLAA